jgi:hypothetical protein
MSECSSTVTAEYIEFYMYVLYARLWHGYGEDTFHIYIYSLCRDCIMAVVFTDFIKVSVFFHVTTKSFHVQQLYPSV